MMTKTQKRAGNIKKEVVVVPFVVPPEVQYVVVHRHKVTGREVVHYFTTPGAAFVCYMQMKRHNYYGAIRQL